MNQQTYNLADFAPGLVAIPAQEMMWTASATSFLELTQALPPGSAIRIGRQSSSAEWNRNRLTEDFLRDAPANDWEWILYIDSDMIVPALTAARLLSHNVDCVGALYYSRREPPVAEFNRIGEDPTPVNGLLRCRWIGAGCLLVARSVIERLPEPWWPHAPNPGEGEDLCFSAKVKALGVPVYLDPALQVGHMMSHVLTKSDADAYFASAQGQARMMIATAGSESYKKRTADAVAEAGR